MDDTIKDLIDYIKLCRKLYLLPDLSHSVISTLLQIANHWSQTYDRCKTPPDFVQDQDYDVILESDELPAPPSTWRDLIEFHQLWTTRLLHQHQNPVQTGDFQTQSDLAMTVIRFINPSPVSPQDHLTVLDPTCGTGIFLLQFLNYFKTHDRPNRLRLIGVERNLDSMILAWLTLTVAVELMNPAVMSTEQIFIDLFHQDILDFLRPTSVQLDRFRGQVDLVIGNPPWITWTDLPGDDKQRWKDCQRHLSYSFIQVSGMDLAMGHVNTDIGILIMIRALHQLLLPSGRFAFLFKAEMINSSSLYWMRQGEIPHLQPRTLAIQSLVKFRGHHHFIGRNDLATDLIVGQMDIKISAIDVYLSSRDTCDLHDTIYPIPVTNPPDTFFLPTSPSTSVLSSHTPAHKIEIRHGLKHDCKKVYHISFQQAEDLNWQCIYPTIKSRHIQASGWTGEYELVLVPQTSLSATDPEVFAQQYPLAFQYLAQHRNRLLRRKSRWIKTGPFYSVFGIGDYSFSPYKIAWVRLGWKPYFAVIPPVELPNGEIKPVVPSDHFLFIPTENLEYAHFVAKLLNSESYQCLLHQLSSKKKSSLPKKLMTRLNIPSESEWIEQGQ